MKAVILAGGFGTRLSELTGQIPKPMLEIGGKPLLWHIMNIYAHHGITEFIIALGYKSEFIKHYFLNSCPSQNRLHPNWCIHLVETGLHTQTGGRIKRLKEWIGNETFMLTYGDGVSDVDIRKLLELHHMKKKLATVTAVHPPARFGRVFIEKGNVTRFAEKDGSNEGWISGGFFVMEPQVLDLIEGDQTILERAPLEHLAATDQLAAYCHEGFWKPVDTLKEYQDLESLWQSGNPPWKMWQ